MTLRKGANMFILRKVYCYEPFLDDYIKQIIDMFQRLDHELSLKRLSGSTDFGGMMLEYTSSTLSKEIQCLIDSIASDESLTSDEFLDKLETLHLSAYTEVIQPYYENISRKFQFTDFEKRLYHQYVNQYIMNMRPGSFFRRVCDVDEQNRELNRFISLHAQFRVAEMLGCDALKHNEVLQLCQTSLYQRLSKYCQPEFMQEFSKAEIHSMMLKDAVDELTSIISYLSSQLIHSFQQRCVISEDFVRLPAIANRLVHNALLEICTELASSAEFLLESYDLKFVKEFYEDLYNIIML